MTPHEYTITTSPIRDTDLTLPKKRAFLDRQSPNLPRLHTLCIAAAKRGGGKTTTVTSMLRIYQKQGLADRVFILSPTAVSNSEFYDGLAKPEDIFPPTNASLNQIITYIEAEAEAVKEYEAILGLYKFWQKFLKSKKSVESIDLDLLYDLEKNGIMDMDSPPVPKYESVRPVIHVLFDDIQGTELM